MKIPKVTFYSRFNTVNTCFKYTIPLVQKTCFYSGALCGLMGYGTLTTSLFIYEPKNLQQPQFVHYSRVPTSNSP
jgi:hypothetical protein